MSEHHNLIPSIIAAAVAAAGERKNDAAWKGKINDAIPAIAAMLNPPAPGGRGSRQWQIAAEVLGADVFVATYRGHTLEDSSKRNIVTLETRPSKKYPDGLEPIRTHRTDNAQGRHMAERLADLADGDEIVVWKAMETSATDDSVKVRVLVHFETRPKRSGPPAGGAARQPERVEVEPPAAAPNTAAGGSLGYMLEELSTKDKLKAITLLREEGISFPEPQPDRADRYIAIIDSITAR